MSSSVLVMPFHISPKPPSQPPKTHSTSGCHLNFNAAVSFDFSPRTLLPGADGLHSPQFLFDDADALASLELNSSSGVQEQVRDAAADSCTSYAKYSPNYLRQLRCLHIVQPNIDAYPFRVACLSRFSTYLPTHMHDFVKSNQYLPISAYLPTPHMYQYQLKQRPSVYSAVRIHAVFLFAICVVQGAPTSEASFWADLQSAHDLLVEVERTWAAHAHDDLFDLCLDCDRRIRREIQVGRRARANLDLAFIYAQQSTHELLFHRFGAPVGRDAAAQAGVAAPTSSSSSSSSPSSSPSSSSVPFVVSVVCGQEGVAGGVDGMRHAATLRGPSGVLELRDGRQWLICEKAGHAIRMVNASGAVTTLAGRRARRGPQA
eukprot:137867-Pleurochrysis_carterae.AAC.1